MKKHGKAQWKKAANKRKHARKQPVAFESRHTSAAVGRRLLSSVRS